MGETITLRWKRFASMVAACRDFRHVCCVYVIADPSTRPMYIGCSESKGGLDGRYHGGTASAVDAALHGSGNLVFVAEVARGGCDPIEKALIWSEQPPCNRRFKNRNHSSLSADSLLNEGVVPAFKAGRRTP